MLAIVGCGQRWLNFDHAVLRYTSEAALPFYMLHQVAVLTVAVTIVEWRSGVAVKMAVISTLAFAVTMLIYELLIRRSRLVRPLFGLKVTAPAHAIIGRAVESR